MGLRGERLSSGGDARRRRSLRGAVSLLVAASTILPALGGVAITPAHAAPSAADRAQARKLAGEAMDLYAAGDYPAAYEKFAAADELVPAPTLELRMARSLDKMDRLQEAATFYRKVIAFELDRFAPKVHRQARKQAVPELAALLEQVPKVVVTVEGPEASEAEVTMGGEAFPRESLGEEIPLDPGVYRFEARQGERVVSETVDLARGTTERVALALPMLPEPDEQDQPPTPMSDERATDPMVIAGWTAIGVGGLGLIVGGATGIAMLAKEGGLEDRCPDRQCPPSEHDAARAFDRLRVTTTVGLIVAGVGGAAGATLLLLAPGLGEEGDAVAVTPFVSPLGGGVVGTF